jgi:hypothetical protein
VALKLEKPSNRKKPLGIVHRIWNRSRRKWRRWSGAFKSFAGSQSNPHCRQGPPKPRHEGRSDGQYVEFDQRCPRRTTARHARTLHFAVKAAPFSESPNIFEACIFITPARTSNGIEESTRFSFISHSSQFSNRVTQNESQVCRSGCRHFE